MKLSQSIKCAIAQKSPLPFELKVLEALLSGEGRRSAVKGGVTRKRRRGTAAGLLWPAVVFGWIQLCAVIILNHTPGVPSASDRWLPRSYSLFTSCVNRDCAFLLQQEQAAQHRGGDGAARHQLQLLFQRGGAAAPDPHPAVRLQLLSAG